MIKRMTVGELKKKEPVWRKWMARAVETLDDSDEIIAHYWRAQSPTCYVLAKITFDEFGPPLN